MTQHRERLTVGLVLVWLEDTSYQRGIFKLEILIPGASISESYGGQREDKKEMAEERERKEREENERKDKEREENEQEQQEESQSLLHLGKSFLTKRSLNSEPEFFQSLNLRGLPVLTP